MRRLNNAALYTALDERRRARDITWAELARETGVSATTIRRIELGGRMEVDGLLALAGWLEVPVETFVRDTDAPA